VENVAWEGGAVSLEDLSRAEIRESIFDANQSGWGGGVLVREGELYMIGCTLAENSSLIGSGLAVSAGAAAFVDHSILAFGDDTAVECYSGGSAWLTCCDVYGNTADWDQCIADQWGQAGNFSADPLFCGGPDRPRALRPESPCAPGNNLFCGLIGAGPVGCGTSSASGQVDGWGRRAARIVSENPCLPPCEVRWAETPVAAVATADPGTLRLEIFDPSGRLVRSLPADPFQGAVLRDGREAHRVLWEGPYVHGVLWDGNDAHGAPVPRGLYLLRVRGAAGEKSGRLLLLRP
jgi:hypothetical protein